MKLSTPSALFIAGVVLLMLGATASMVGVSFRSVTTSPTPSSYTTEIVTPIESAPYNSTQPTPVYPPIIRSDNITWFSEPKPYTSGLLPLIIPPHGSQADVQKYISYYQLGTDNLGNPSRPIILVTAPPDGPGSDLRYVFVYKGGDAVAFLPHHSTAINQGPDDYQLAPRVSVDAQTLYRGLQIPETITYQGKKLTSAFSFSSQLFLSDYKFDEKLKLTSDITHLSDGDLYQLMLIPDLKVPNLFLHEFLLRTKSNVIQGYQMNPPILSDNGTLQATWNDASPNRDPYQYSSGGGCGDPGYVLMARLGASDTTEVIGTTRSGEALYQLTNKNNPIIRFFYDQLGGSYYQYDPGTAQSTQIPFSLDEYVAKHGVVLYRDQLNRWIVLHNTKYGLQAECGKPVIYLYPTKTTDVSVQVGAKIRESEPTYDTGWQVTAQPDGTLTTVDGSTYDSLYWEGLGNGAYPEITQGFVVKQAGLEATLRSHLAQLGLNAREAQDFLDFWLAKMPTTPYVRLTWFGTRQMNELAPLAITPRPDSVIRIFLDFEGLDHPISITPERLSAIPRKGFTVVEWGGLLRK